MLPAPEPLRSATLSVREEDRGTLARANDPMPVDMLLSTPGYFDLMGVPLLRGRRPSTGRHWMDDDHQQRSRARVVGRVRSDRQTIQADLTDASRAARSRRHRRVRFTSCAEWHVEPRIYRSVKEWRASRYLIRTAGPAAELADTVRRIAREEMPTDADRPTNVARADRRGEMSGMRTSRLAASSVTTLVLLLASIGLYGIVALSVGQRRREIGVRMALGARSGQVVGLFYRSGLKLGALGLVLGLPISLVATRVFPALAEQAGRHAQDSKSVAHRPASRRSCADRCVDRHVDSGYARGDGESRDRAYGPSNIEINPR